MVKTCTIITEVWKYTEKMLIVREAKPQEVIEEFGQEGEDKNDGKYRYRVLFVLDGAKILYDADKLELEARSFNDGTRFINDIRRDFIYKMGQKSESFINKPSHT